MNTAWLDLFTKKKDDVIELLHAVRAVTKELRGIVERTGEIVTENLPDSRRRCTSGNTGRTATS